MATGIEEAVAGGKALKADGFAFDVAHTSVLKRAQVTLATVLEQIGQTDLPVEKTWRLNERHYGGLTGLIKAETAAKHGDAQVQVTSKGRCNVQARTNAIKLKGLQLCTS